MGETPKLLEGKVSLATTLLNGRLSEAVDWYTANAGAAVSRRGVRHGRMRSRVLQAEGGRALLHTEELSVLVSEGAPQIGDGVQLDDGRWIVREVEAQSDGLARCLLEQVVTVERGRGAGDWRGRLS